MKDDTLRTYQTDHTDRLQIDHVHIDHLVPHLSLREVVQDLPYRARNMCYQLQVADRADYKQYSAPTWQLEQDPADQECSFRQISTLVDHRVEVDDPSEMSKQSGRLSPKKTITCPILSPPFFFLFFSFQSTYCLRPSFLSPPLIEVVTHIRRGEVHITGRLSPLRPLHYGPCLANAVARMLHNPFCRHRLASNLRLLPTLRALSRLIPFFFFFLFWNCTRNLTTSGFEATKCIAILILILVGSK